MLAKYSLSNTIISHFGSQYVSETFKMKCIQNGITLAFSSPLQHQTDSLAEQKIIIGTCKFLLVKATESECACTSLWMNHTTPLDNQLPSPPGYSSGPKLKHCYLAQQATSCSNILWTTPTKKQIHTIKKSKQKSTNRKPAVTKKDLEKQGASVCM